MHVTESFYARWTSPNLLFLGSVDSTGAPEASGRHEEARAISRLRNQARTRQGNESSLRFEKGGDKSQGAQAVCRLIIIFGQNRLLTSEPFSAQLKQYDKLKPPVEKLKKERTKMKEKEQKLKTDRRRKEKQHEQWQNSMEEKTEQIDQEVQIIFSFCR
eukprot:SAG31_NODE_206_length_20335_cov_17.910160_20_plen_159_part_00